MLTDLLIEGDYMGSVSGETNVALNCGRFLVAFLEAAEKLLPEEKVRELRERAYMIRSKRWPGGLRW